MGDGEHANVGGFDGVDDRERELRQDHLADAVRDFWSRIGVLTNAVVGNASLIVTPR